MKKLHLILNKDQRKFIIVALLTLLLILVSIILFEDVSLDNRILIYNIFLTLAILSFLYSYSLAKRKINIKIAFGKTRKEIYKDYLINIGYSLLSTLVLTIYYIFIYQLVANSVTSVFVLFDFGSLLILPLLFLIFSFLGFLFGIVQMKRRFFYPLFILIVGVTTAIIMIFRVHFAVDIALIFVAGTLAYANYYMLMHHKEI